MDNRFRTDGKAILMESTDDEDKRRDQRDANTSEAPMAGKQSKTTNTTVTATKTTRRRIKPSATKRGTILAMLQRPKGASIVDLTRATGWQADSVRAALTGLRKRDIEVVREAQGGISRYRVPTA